MIQNKFYKLGDLNKKIALFSDIHFNIKYDVTIFEQIIINLNNNHPDFICIPGDILDDAEILNKKEEMEKLTNFFKEISLIAPVIISPGNHDFTNVVKNKRNYVTPDEYFLSLKKNENIHYLNNKSLVRNNITFTGFNPSFDYYYSVPKEDKNKFIFELDEKISVKQNDYNVLLCHTPKCIFQKDTLKKSKNIHKFDLILSGHMHNGLVFKCFDKFGHIGFVGPFYKPFPKYARGHMINKDVKTKHLIISGGVKKISFGAPKIFHKLNLLYPISIDYIEL